MAISLYDLSVANYLQTLGGVAGFVWRQAVFALLVLLEFKIGAKFPLKVGRAVPDPPPLHLNSPRLRAT